MTLQYIIIGCILAICVVYAGYRAYQTFTDKDSHCRGCQLKDACTRHARKERQYPHGCSRT